MPPPLLSCPGTDTHLVIRPLMERVEVKNYDAALRKITFPHVSTRPPGFVGWATPPAAACLLPCVAFTLME